MNTDWIRSVIAVGAGRGFLVEHDDQRLVITAAHCLPQVPEPMPARYAQENTFPLLAPLGKEPSVWAEIIFCDVITDIAVLGEPDGQTFSDEYAAYGAFTESRPALRLGDIPPSDLGEHQLRSHHVHVLGLGGGWVCGRGQHVDRPLWLEGCRIERGMSGSPIINERGEAIGVVSTGGPDPRLARDLPGWLAPPPVSS